MKLHIFNPENDLALADGNANYCPPPAARAIAGDLATLPLWYAQESDSVFLPGILHSEFHKEMSALFPLARPFVQGSAQAVDECRPWGWSAQIRRRLVAMGVREEVLPGTSFVESVRSLSNRRTAIALLRSLCDAGIDTPEIPQYFTSPDDVAAFIESMPRSVIKAPWSGSGKGIAWGIGRVEIPVEHFYKGVIRRQGGVVCERFLDKVVDFAMEFSVSGGVVAFAGYSLFKCDGSAYSGNVLAADDTLENFIASYVGQDTLTAVKDRLIAELENLLLPVGYSGYLGVDMLVYRSGEEYRLYPCVELNLRMNMGAVSRIFFDRYVSRSSVGRFFVSNFRNEGEAFALHEKFRAEHPLCLHNGVVQSGYLNLSPVTRESRYLAYALVYDNSFTVQQLYCGE